MQHRCPICAAPLPEDASRCGTCGRVFEPGERPVSHAPGAVAAVIWGALSLFFCGILLGIVAIAQAGRAQQAIALNPELKGAGMARTGQVLGIVAIISNVLGVIYVFATVVGQ